MLCIIRIASFLYTNIDRMDVPKLCPFASLPGAMINPQWLELSMSRTNFHGAKDVPTIAVRLCVIPQANHANRKDNPDQLVHLCSI